MSNLPITLAAALGAATTAPSVASPALFTPGAMTVNEPTQVTFWASGTFGTSTMATLQIEASPDTPNTPDAVSEWHAITALAFTAAGFGTFTGNALKYRAVTTSGDAGTSITVRMT